jgi:hypothetical protein
VRGTCHASGVDVRAVDEGGVALQEGEPLAVAHPQRRRGHPARVADDHLTLGVAAADTGIGGPGGGHSGTAGGGQPGAALERADEDLGRGEREQDREVGSGREQIAPGVHPLSHGDQIGFGVRVDHRDQMGVRDGHRGERQARVEFGQARLDRRLVAGHHGMGGVEVDRRVLEPDLVHALGRGGAPAHRVVTPAAADQGRVGAAQVQDDPPQAAHAVAAELGRRTVGVEEPGLGHGPAGVVEVDTVAAERTTPVAQVADECVQVGIGGEVTGRQGGDEDVVLRAVRVEDLCHRRPAYPSAMVGQPGRAPPGRSGGARVPAGQVARAGRASMPGVTARPTAFGGQIRGIGRRPRSHGPFSPGGRRCRLLPTATGSRSAIRVLPSQKPH